MKSRFVAQSLVGLFLVVALSGCVATETGEDDEGADGIQSGVDLLNARLEAIPTPKFAVGPEVDWWQNYVQTYTKRDNGLPNNVPAANAVAARMRDAGYEVQILTYEADVGTGGTATTVRVVEAIKEGTSSPDDWVALISHYDTQTNTIEGAYDDGSGVAVALSICDLLANVPTNKTIACLFFDAEERGLVSSGLYTEDKIAEGDEEFRFVQGFGYDMVGLNWPGFTDWKLYAMAGLDNDLLGAYMPENLEFLNHTIFDFLGRVLNVTMEGVEVLDVHDRNSDEQNFKRNGVPVVRFAGGRRAADYPQYHQPQDTAEFVYQYAGGRENFELGYEMAVLVSYYTILAYDSYDPLNLPRF